MEIIEVNTSDGDGKIWENTISNKATRMGSKINVAKGESLYLSCK